jgi:hypothetical protein
MHGLLVRDFEGVGYGNMMDLLFVMSERNDDTKGARSFFWEA